jgi:Na+/H+ antiporter NhaA
MSVGVFTLLIFALEIASALLSGWLADRKGYSFPLFGFIGLLLGPFAVIIAAVMPPKRAARVET